MGLNDKTARRYILILEKLFLLRRREPWFRNRIKRLRDKDQYEVDIVAEELSGRVVGIEVKASATVRGEDFRGLRKLADAAGEDFRLGVVLYDGNRVFSFGDRFAAAPVSALWMPSSK